MSNLPPVPVDYTNRDYASVLAALQAAIPTYMHEWTSTSENDFGQVLLELFSFQNDTLNYYLDRIANESFLGTCQQLSSALQIANLIGYEPTQASASTAPLALNLNSGVNYPVTIPQGAQFTTAATPSTPAVPFQTVQAYTFTAAGSGLAVDSNGIPIIVVQGVTIANEVEGASNGSANQSFSLFNQPVIAGSVYVYVDQGLGPKMWRQVNSLASAGPTDLVYTLSTDENGVTWVSFGDGYNGAVPAASPAGSSGVTATYRVGGGSAGNVGANQITVDGTGITGLIASVTNPLAAAGGQDPESILEIQSNAPQSLSAGNRAVSLQDYAAVALQIPSVAKAAAAGTLVSNITLYVHPATSPLTMSDLTSLVAKLSPTIQTFMLNLVQPGSSITVLPPQYLGAPGYVPVAVAVTVSALPQHQASQVQQDVMAAIDNLLDFTSTDFGAYISQASVYQAIMQTVGVSYCNLTAMCRYENLTNNISGSLAGPVGDIVCAAYEIPVVVDPNVATTLVQVTVIGGS